MMSPAASLLQHLLTRADLSRLEIPAAQIEAWRSAGLLEPVAGPATAEADDEQVFAVADAALRTDLAARLAKVGKPTVLLSRAHIHAFLHRAAGGGSGAAAARRPSVSDAVAQLPDGDFAELFAAAVAELDGDLETVVRLAREVAGTESSPPAPARAHTPLRRLTDTEESMLLDNPIHRRRHDDSEWFDTAELAAAMGDLGASAGANDPADGESAPLNDLVPLAEDDLEELAALVAFHSEQLERLVDLPHSIDLLTRQVEQLHRALQDGEPLPPSIAEQATFGASRAADGRRTSLLAIGLALLCWSGLVWVGTGSTTLALVSFAAANAIGFLAVRPAGQSR